MTSTQNPISPRPRGIYLLPNLFTTATLFFGFFAIVSSMNSHYGSASLAIFVAMVTDALDGRVARLTQSQTAFGTEYDSLADLVAFGVAPSIITYKWALILLGKFGWLIAFIFTASVALRLARFNTQVKNQDKRYFQGLACPAGAACLASLVWFGHTYALNRYLAFIIAIFIVAIAALMVSNIRYRSFKDIDLKGKVPFFTLLVIVLIFAAVAIDPPSVLLVLSVGYALSGPIQTLIQLRAKRLVRLKKKKG